MNRFLLKSQEFPNKDESEIIIKIHNLLYVFPSQMDKEYFGLLLGEMASSLNMLKWVLRKESRKR